MTADPSLKTNPSLSLSQGRLAISGSSFRDDSAFIAAKPAIVVGEVDFSAPPANIASTSPAAIIRAAKPILWVPVVQAVVIAIFGP